MSRFQLSFRVIIVLGTFALFIHLLTRDYFVESLEIREQQVLARSSEESYLGVYFKDERIGFVRNFFSVINDDEVLLEQEAFLKLNILGENHPLTMKGQAVLTQNYLLKSFDFMMEAPFYSSAIKGQVYGTDIRLTIDTGKDTVEDTIHLKDKPFFSTNRRAYLLQDSLEPGKKVKVPYFDPISLTAQDTIVEYKGREKILINNRVFNLHKFEEMFSGVRVKSWLNDNGQVVKEESPAGFIFIAEPEFKARAISGNTVEILSAVSIPVQGTIDNISKRDQLRLYIEVPEADTFTLHKDRQDFERNVLTITKETVNSSMQVCQKRQGFLEATSYVQAHHDRMMGVVNEVTSVTMTGFEKVGAIARWVFETVEKRPVLGIPDSLSVLNSKKGDCNEHSALFAALARSANVPAKVVAGVTYNKGAFYYHAWNEVCLDEKWVSVDTTLNQFPADVGHLKFVEGEIAEQVKIGALLGQLSIRVLE